MALAAGLDGKRTLANQLEITSTAFRLDKTLSGCNYSQMLLFSLTSLMSVPLQTNGRKPDVRAIFSVDDFPTYLAQEGVSRIVHVRVTVRPDGVLQSCSAEVSSGDGKLDAYTCQLIVRRAKFVPARWPDGTAAYGVIRVPVNWLVANGPLPDDAENSFNYAGGGSVQFGSGGLGDLAIIK